jgi:RHS repeat-associated protein
MENRLTKVSRSDSTLVATFDYDALGRRIEKVDTIAGTTTRYYYDDQRVAVQTQVSGGVESDDRYFVFGNYIDEVLIMRTAAGTETYYAHDHLYSPVALFASNGTVAERYEYDAYGSVQILTSNFNPLTSSQHGNPYTFTGRELDTLDNNTLHLMYYRARTYDPKTGRFMQRDPLGIDPASGEINPFGVHKQYVDGTNIYEYVQSLPLSYMDAFGLRIIEIPFPGEGYPRPPRPGESPQRPPSLKQVGSFPCCESGTKAIELVNKALQSGECRNWFTEKSQRYPGGETYRVRLRKYKGLCLIGAYMYTLPFSNDIAFCEVSCDNSTETNALLLIHEIAHHYVTIGPGREDSANEAMDACGNAVSNAAKTQK